MPCTWKNMRIYYDKLQKNYFKIHSFEKGFVGKKNMCSLFL